MKIGRFEISKVLQKEGYKIVYLVLAEKMAFFLHEYSEPELADHEFLFSEYISSNAVDQFVEKFVNNGKTILVQEYTEGISAELYFSENRPLLEKIDFAKSILSILKEIHSKGIIYNNLSLKTITIGPHGDPMLHNFVSATIAGEDRTSIYRQILNPHFVAPERTERVEGITSAASDYYSFGVLLYWLLTGKLPFESDNLSHLISLHVAKQPVPPVSVESKISKGLSEIVEKLLEKDKSDRYKSIDGILFDLEHYNDPGFKLSSQDMDLKFRVTDKIYGRELEIGLLKAAVKELADGKGRLVTIAGYSGVGKSTIVSEFQKKVAPVACRLISGKFQQYKRDIPYFAIVEAFNTLFDMLLLSEQTVLDDFCQLFTESIGEQGLILTSIFPKLESIVGKQAPVDKLVGEEAENRFNYFFLKLINMVATEDRPLTLFLDDLQWTDLVSLNVLRAILQNGPSFLLVILAYRSNEVDQHHPLQQFLDEAGKYNVFHRKMVVRDLEPDDVSMLIEDSLGYRDSKLSHIVFYKTHGNAFFVHQLLKGLADQSYFHRDVKNKIWTIDTDKVSDLQVSSNVVDFMQTRLKRLPRETTDLMRIIGAVGHHVSLDVLSVVTGIRKDHISKVLKLPFEDGLLYYQQDHVYFTHDKIEQACYQLNRIDRLPELHFNIAKTLMHHELSRSLDELFNLVAHLDKAFDLIHEDHEKYIEIYMKAAVKSKEISAYGEFLVYVRQAMALLQDSVPDLMRSEVYQEYHIALYLNSLFEEADEFFYEKLAGCQDFMDLKENYFSKVSQDSMRRRYKEATVFGMSILKKMGIELRIDPQAEDLAHELNEVEALFAKAGIKKISELRNIERKNIHEMEFICELILAMVPAAFFYQPTVACLLIFTTLKLAVQNGVFEAMGYPLSVASTPFILIRNDYLTGYEYAEYALQIAANNKRSLGNAKHLFILFCWHWSRSIKDDTAIEIAREAHHLLMQGGDIQMAGYTYYNTGTYYWERGEKLDVVLAELEKGLDFNRKTQNLHGVALISPYYQVVQTLMSDDGDFLNFSTDGFSETVFIKNNLKNSMGLCFLYIYKAQLAFIFEAHKEAYDFGQKARALLYSIPGFLSIQTGVFYGALSACTVLEPADEGFSTIFDDLEQLKQWNEGAPGNFSHKVHLLEAEIARKKKDIPLAIRCYIEGIAASRHNRFLHETAIIYERFSSFWEEQENEELCEYYVKEAFHNYDLWGAKRKCNQLRHKYRNVYFESQTQNLDLLSVIRSQNILAQETNIESLLKQMMQILLEVSGAERGFLILKDNAWSIEAFKNIQGEESILESLPLEEEMLSVDMVHYVIRTGQIADLEQFSGYLEDAYLDRIHPQSLIVLPADVGSRLIAVIYLEHRRIKNIFTLKKQEMIKLLSTQVAISLDNARIYNQLEQRIQERTEELAAQNEELAIARKKADEANRAKSEFLANMSHELRTPLNAVTGFSELLSLLVSDSKQKSYLDAIKSAGRSLLTLINDILDLSKIESGGMDITYAPVNLSSIFMEIDQIFSNEIDSKNLAFSIALSPDQPEWLYLDEIRIRQILLNLVGNAIKFTEDGFVKISSTYEKKGEDRVRLIICVEDSGIGIFEEEQETIFKSFEQQSGQDVARYGGTGLGLTITKRLVELMGGVIAVSSTPGKGSRFSVEFLDVKKAFSEKHPLETGPLTFENVQFSEARVLVVDDIESNRVLLKEILVKTGLEVITAGNGQEAISMAKKLKPKLILMDIRMPVLNGFEAAKQLKKNDDTSQIPIIALSASSAKNDKTTALRHGFDGFLAKPFSIESLIKELSIHLEYRIFDTIRPELPEFLDGLYVQDVLNYKILSRRLKQDILPSFQRLKKTFVAGDFRNLGNMLDEIGKEFQVEMLSGFGLYMLKVFSVFDIHEMDECLVRYSEIIKKLIVDSEN